MATNLNTVPKLEKRVIRVLKTHGVKFIRNRADQAAEKKLKDTNTLINSFDFAVVPATGNSPTTLRVSFVDHGRYIDMKSSAGRWTQQPPVEEIEESLRRKGIGSLKGRSVEVERQRGNPGWQDRAFRNSAWAIAKSIKKKGIKRRRWYAKNRWEDINRMYADLIDAYQEWAAEAHKKEIRDTVDNKNIKART